MAEIAIEHTWRIVTLARSPLRPHYHRHENGASWIPSWISSSEQRIGSHWGLGAYDQQTRNPAKTSKECRSSSQRQPLVDDEDVVHRQRCRQCQRQFHPAK